MRLPTTTDRECDLTSPERPPQTDDEAKLSSSLDYGKLCNVFADAGRSVAASIAVAPPRVALASICLSRRRWQIIDNVLSIYVCNDDNISSHRPFVVYSIRRRDVPSPITDYEVTYLDCGIWVYWGPRLLWWFSVILCVLTSILHLM